MGEYIKIVHRKYVYYILEQHLHMIQLAKSSLGSLDFDRRLMQYSQFVVNQQTNEILRCRASMEQLVDSAIMG